MRTFRILAALMMAVVCVGLSSCSKDDDGKLIVDSIAGTWISETHGGGAYEYTQTMILNENGTGTMSTSYEFYPEENSSEEITYSYSDKSKLTINHIENDYSETYDIKFFKSESGTLQMEMRQGSKLIGYHKI